MSYLDPNQDELLKGQKAPAGNDTNQAPSSASSAASSGPGAYSPNTPTSGTGATGFQNLQGYLDANQGSNVTGQVADKLQGQADTAREDLRTAQSGFQDQVNQNAVKSDPNNLQSVLADPAKASDSDTASFQKQLNANYSGPTDANSYAGYQKATAEGQNAYNSAQAAKNQGGATALLDQYFGNPNYNQGQKSLDSALFMGGDQTALNNVQQNVQNMPAEFQQVGKQLNTFANQGQADTQAAKEAAANALYGQGGSAADIKGGAVKDALGLVDATTASNKTDAAINYQNELAMLGNRTPINASGRSGSQLNLNADQRKALGFNDAKGSLLSLYDVNPANAKYLTQAADPTTGQSATPEEVARLNALAKLGGTPQSWLNTDQAGTYSANPRFNMSQLQADVGVAQNGAQGNAEYQNALANYKAAVNSGNQANAQAAGRVLTGIQSKLGFFNQIVGT